MLKKLFIKGVFLSLFASLSFTQDEQVTVIGSLIKGTPIDTGSPISTFDSESIVAQNNLNIVELIRMVPGANGMDGESNQFGSNGAEGVSNINMRGLGTQRTLVLINGKRQVTVPIRSGANRSVNLHDLPMAALSRIEILKEGAAATYGSDAIAGVVNFITDSTFEGLKVNIGAKGFQGAENEGKEFALTYGSLIGEDVNFVMSLGHQYKPQIAIKDTNFGIRPFTQNTNGGWSTMGNPGTYVYPGGGTAAALGNTAFLSDPGCNNAGGLNTSFAALPGATKVNGDEALTGFCRYQYTYFDNVQEEQKNTQLWMEFNGAIDAHDWHVEFSYGHTDVPNWATSPSYPPNNPSTNTVPDHNPGFVQLLADNPTFASALTDANYGGDGTNIASAHRVRTRTMAAAGNPFGNTNGAETESREYDTYRFAFSFDGPLTEEIDYSTSLNYSSSTGLTTSSDTQQGKFLAALWGYGGPTCDAEITAKTTSASDLTPTFVVKSTGAAIAANVVNAATRPTGCSYLNATSNAIQQAMQPNQTTGERVGVNPDYDATLANSQELIRWLVDKRYTESTSNLLTADFIMQGTMGMLAGGDAAWAFGYERRDYNIKTTLPIQAGPTATNAMTNIHDGNLYPCEMPRDNATKAGRDACAANPVGLFMFLAPTFEEDQNQTVDSLFAEFALPITDEFDMQLALRYEDYGSKDSVDPKMVMRWTPIPSLTLRFTGQTTFRAAHPDEMSATRVTALQYVNQAGAFKAVDISGNANLDPEEATTYNFGFVTDFGTDNWKATLDFYDFEFKNPIITENHQQLVNAFASTDAATKAAVAGQMFGGVDTLAYNASTNNFTAASVGRIASNFVNGPETLTNGVDLYVQYETDYANGVITTGLEMNYVAKYDVAAYIKDGVQIAPAVECVGFFNIANNCRSMPDLKGKAFINYVAGDHNFYGALNYISAYDDRRSNLEVTPHTTVDATYTYSWDDSFDVSLSIYNLTDEDPSYVSNEMNYDPYTHSPLGRYIKAGFTYRMQ